MAIFQPDTNLMTQLQGYRSQRGLTSGQRLSTPEWRGIVEGYNSSQYRNALEMAKIAEQRRQQATQIQAQKDMMDQRMQGSELKGAGQLGGGLYSGYKMGQDVGLWGNKPATSTTGPTVSPAQSNYDPSYASSSVPAEPPPGLASTAPSTPTSETLSSIGGQPYIQKGAFQTPGEFYGTMKPASYVPTLGDVVSAPSDAGGVLSGMSGGGLGALATPIEASSEIGSIVGSGAAGLGTELASGTAAGASAAAPAAAGSSVAGPIGMGVGGAMLLASLLGFGPEEWF